IELDPDRVVVALDVRGGRAQGDGWSVSGASAELDDLIGSLLDQGVVTFEVTAIERDGTLEGPDLELLRRVRQLTAGASAIASGGIRSGDDLRALRGLACDGAIIGRAIYDGTLSLGDALVVEREAIG